MPIDVDSLLIPKDEDWAYEEDILRNPYIVKSWLRYLYFKHDAPPHVRNVLYERALKELPGSYKLWHMYLQDRVRQVRGRRVDDPAYEIVNNAFDRCLVYLHKMPRIWIEYVQFLMNQRKVTQTRRVLDRALRSLALTQHERIWKLYLQFVAAPYVPVQTGIRVFRRYLKYDPTQKEAFVEYLVEREEWNEAAHQLVAIVNDEDFATTKGKSKHDYWLQLCEIISKHSEDIKNLKVDALIRGGVTKFSDEVGKLWITLADYHIRLAHFDKARDVFEEAMNTVITVKDFTQIWEAYAKFEDSLLAATSANDDEDNEDEVDFDLRIARYENLIERQPLLVNSVLLRQNPHNVKEWEKRAALYAKYPEKVVETYTEALSTVDPQRAVGKPHTLWVNFAKFYEQLGSLDDARKIFHKATQAELKYVDDLATVWCEFVEMELRHKNLEEARKLLQQATVAPDTLKRYNEKEPVQKRVYRSTKLWALYADIEESIGNFMSTKTVYEKMFDLRIVTPQIVINYAHFLEQNKYFEESFKAYEKGIALFKFPHVYDIWIAYLTKFIARYGGRKLERARELFEQVIDSCPAPQVKVFYIMYANLEEEYGLVRHSMSIYDRATRVVAEEDRFAVFCLYIDRATEYFGVTKTREIYQKAVDMLPEKQAKEMCLRFAKLEERLGEIDRARSIYVYASQFCDPRIEISFWAKWKQFEVDYGNPDTFREMLRIKRSVQAKYSQQLVGFVSAGVLPVGQTPAEQQQPIQRLETDMEALERLSKVQTALTSKATAAAANPEEISLDEAEEEKDEVDIEQLAVPAAVIDRNVPSDNNKQEGALSRLRKKQNA